MGSEVAAKYKTARGKKIAVSLLKDEDAAIKQRSKKGKQAEVIETLAEKTEVVKTRTSTTNKNTIIANEDGGLPKEETADSQEAFEKLQKQINAFEKLLQHAMNRFSREKLYNMLKLMSINMIEKGEIEESSPVHITSMEHLQNLIQQLIKSHKGLTHIRDDEKHLVHYFTTFFEDLEYLMQLKRYFDEKIYIFLYEHFYDPLDDALGIEDLVQAQTSAIEEADLTSESRVSISSHPLIGRESTNEITSKEEEIVFDFLSKHARLSHAVQHMYKINKKWESIMDRHNPHLLSYDPDSKFELVSFAGYSRYEPVLRLLPDIFVKAYKSIEMAKLWWNHASKLYAGKPLRRRGLQELTKQEVEFEHHIEKITEDIQRFEQTVHVRKDDLSKLKERESRFQNLSVQCEKLEERKDVATKALNTIQKQVQEMSAELDLYQKDTKKYAELARRLKEKDKQLALTQDELRILAFHFHIVQEDFNLELELQPHLIRFRADIESKLTELGDELKVKESERRETEKRLVLLKANCGKMHELMQRYSVMGDNSESPQVSRETTQENIESKEHRSQNQEVLSAKPANETETKLLKSNVKSTGNRQDLSNARIKEVSKGTAKPPINPSQVQKKEIKR